MALTLPQRRSLYARIMANEAFDHPSGDEQFDSVRSELMRLVSQESNATLKAPTNDRLDCFAKRTSKYAVDVIKRTPRLMVCDRGATALVDFNKQAGAINCRNCAAAAGAKICDGSADDDVTVEKGGQCISTLKSIVESAVALARSLYEEHSPEFSRLARKPSVTWSLGHCLADRGRTTPHQIPVPVYATGATRFHDEPGGLASEVILNLIVEGFDFNTQQSLPYIALHEALCHVFQGSASGQNMRPAPGVDFDLFSEGWIDGLIPDIYRELRSGTGTRATLKNVLARDGQVRAGLEMQAARGNSARPDAGFFAPYIARGSVAAAAAREALHRRLGPLEGEASFLQFSLDLNVLLAATKARNNLVNRLVVSQATSAEFKEAFDRFVQTRQTKDFLSKIAI